MCLGVSRGFYIFEDISKGRFWFSQAERQTVMTVFWSNHALVLT